MDKNYLKGVGQRIKETRNERGLTLRALAPLCDLGYDYISRLENGQFDPKLTTLIKIAKALECDFRSFL